MIYESQQKKLKETVNALIFVRKTLNYKAKINYAAHSLKVTYDMRR